MDEKDIIFVYTWEQKRWKRHVSIDNILLSIVNRLEKENAIIDRINICSLLW
jgi:ubiquitin-protein ligase